MAKQQTSQGAHQKTRGEDAKRRNEGGDRVLRRKKVAPDAGCKIAVDAEIVTLPAMPAMMARRSLSDFERIPKPRTAVPSRPIFDVTSMALARI
jgi:hypothetical protein